MFEGACWWVGPRCRLTCTSSTGWGLPLNLNRPRRCTATASGTSCAGGLWKGDCRGPSLAAATAAWEAPAATAAAAAAEPAAAAAAAAAAPATVVATGAKPGWALPPASGSL
jgi:hypothetical protein